MIIFSDSLKSFDFTHSWTSGALILFTFALQSPNIELMAVTDPGITPYGLMDSFRLWSSLVNQIDYRSRQRWYGSAGADLHAQFLAC